MVIDSDDMISKEKPTAHEEEEEELEGDSEEEGHFKGGKRRYRGLHCQKSGLPPRKAIKKLIFSELEKQAPLIFE